MTGLRLWSNGVPLDDLGVVGDADLTINTVYGDTGCGLDTMSWSMSLPRGFAHPAIQEGAVIELRRGLGTIATAINSEPDPDSWKFTAKGLLHRLADFLAVNSAGTPTNNLADALRAAVANGLEIKLPADLPPGLVALDSVDQVLTVADLLNRYCQANSLRWGISGSGWLEFYTDPSTPRWVLTPDAPSMPSARGTVTRLRVRYVTSADSEGNVATLGTVTVGAAAGSRGVVESFQDITSDGVLTEPQATTIALGLLADQAPQQAFTAGVTAGPGQVTSFGDVPMDGALWMVACDVGSGAMIRSQGWRNPDVGANGMHFDWLAGAATWSKSSGLTVTPIAMAASTFGDNMAELRAGIGTAQSTADTAKTLATPDYLQSLINPASKTIQDDTMPAAAALGDLWIKPADPPDQMAPIAYVCTTAYTSGGTVEANWTVATDARTIALIVATSTAVFAADNANAAAQLAQQAANGKNTVTYAAALPTSATAGVVGDTWFVFSGGVVTGQYQLSTISGTTYTWTQVQLDSAVIASLDVGKITGGVASFVSGAIQQLTALTINADTTTWTMTAGSDVIVTQIAGNGMSASINGTSTRVKITSGLAVSGGNGLYVDSGGIQTDGDITAGNAAVTGGNVIAYGSLVTPNAQPTTSAPNATLSSPSGAVLRYGTSSRTTKHSIEPFEPDDDLAALDRCGVFAYHYYFDEAEQRLMIGLIVEDMLEAGLHRYVDFDEDGRPMQPAWHQISALHTAAIKQARRDIADLKAIVADLQETS